MRNFRPLFLSLLLVGSLSLAGQGTALPTTKAAARQDTKARALLDEAKAKLNSLQTLTADFQSSRTPSAYFERSGAVYLERPGRFRVESITGVIVEKHDVQSFSDGTKVTSVNSKDFAAYEKPLRVETFFLGQNFLVQFFFDPRGIAFDPSDSLWGRSVSQFDTNKAAYDRDTQLLYLGPRTLEDDPYDVVEIKYNSLRSDIRQQIYIGRDQLVYQVDTYFDGEIYSQKFRNFQLNVTLPPETWRWEKPEKMPVIGTDPVRLGEEAPDFTLPGATGTEVSLKALLTGKKGLYVCSIDGEAGRKVRNADVHLAQMRMLQRMKDRYEPQGLAVVCIVGGSGITPDLKDEMLFNWLPDLSRFNYPIAIDVDLEKGIQGSAYQNFQLNGRNNLLLDAEGRVVFAAGSLVDGVNQLAFYQALAQIGFAVSPADLEGAAK